MWIAYDLSAGVVCLGSFETEDQAGRRCVGLTVTAVIRVDKLPSGRLKTKSVYGPPDRPPARKVPPKERYIPPANSRLPDMEYDDD